MRVTLSFKLPEEHLAINGSKYYLILQDLDDKLRSMIKYENKQKIDIQNVRDLIVQLKRDYEV